MKYQKQHFKTIAQAIAARPNLSPPANPILITGDNTAKMKFPFTEGRISARFAVDHIAVLLRVLTKLDICISFDYVDKQTGEVKSDKVERITQKTFLAQSK